MSFDSAVDYRWIDGVERLELYEPGGYHPVMLDDLLHDRYRIVDKLGFGGYSTIWLARDGVAKRYIAVKIGISDQTLPQRESEILRALNDSRSDPRSSRTGNNDNGSAALPSILNVFKIHGPNGTHQCYTLTPGQGNLREASFSRLFPIQVARALAANLATSVRYIHSKGYVHGDLHLRNVLVKRPSSFDELSVQEFRKRFGEPETEPVSRLDGKPLTPNIPPLMVVPLHLGKKAQEFTLSDAKGLIFSDFGEAFSPTMEQRFGSDCKTPLARRVPESLFEPDKPMSFPSDVWSLGLALWEILGMKSLFSDLEPMNEIVAQQIDVLGLQNLPEAWKEQWERPYSAEEAETVGAPRRPAGDREMWPNLDDAFEPFVQKYRRKREAAGVFEEAEVYAILKLIRGMLKFRPVERLTMDQVLSSEWMVNWALPQLESKVSASNAAQ